MTSGFNHYITNTLQPEHDWKLDAASPPMEDFGTATDADLNSAGAGASFQQGGDVDYETDEAMDFNGAGNAYILDSASVPQIQHAAGTLMIILSVGTTDVTSDIFFGYGSGSTTASLFFQHTKGGGGHRILMKITNTGTKFAGVSNEATAMNGNNDFHMCHLIQPNDGGGMKFYVNGVDIGRDTDLDVGIDGFDINTWFQDAPNFGRIVVGAHPAFGNNNYDGKIARVSISSNVWTPSQISDLLKLRGQPGLQLGANTRRRGRKFFALEGNEQA